MKQEEFVYLKQKILDYLDIDLNNYGHNQMVRRLDGYLVRNKAISVAQYCQLLQKEPSERDKLRSFLTINVSEFFRDAHFFNVLQERILPALLKRSPVLNIWSAGCSNGAEVYSVIVLLNRVSPFKTHRILATDIDVEILKLAKAGGPYKAADIKNIPKDKINAYFNQIKEEFWIKEDIRKKVIFQQHDLTRDAFEDDFDLIICRNVLIYFSDEIKRELRQKFLGALKDNGILFVGATETMLNAEEIGYECLYPCFYQKANASAEKTIMAVSHK
jgi:chemotaxis protein methyltransferase CheR